MTVALLALGLSVTGWIAAAETLTPEVTASVEPPSASTEPSDTASPTSSDTAEPPSTTAEPTLTTTGLPVAPSTTAPTTLTPESNATTDPTTATSSTTTTVVVPWNPPARDSSPVAQQSLMIALGVLVAAALLLVRVARRGAAHPGAVGSASGATAGPSGSEAPLRADTTRFLVALGEAMVDAGDPVTDVQDTLVRVASRNGVPDSEVIVLATALLVSVPDTGPVSTAVSSAGARSLRLDQIDEVFDVVQDALDGAVAPADGVARLAAIRASKPAFGIAVRIAGYVVMSLGLSLILGASLPEIAVASALGAVVGALQLTGDGPSSTYRTVLPLACAFGVSTIVLLLARTPLDIGVYAPLIAPLVTFLPGALLTTAVLELSTGQMISGSGRLAAGAMRLVLLALGIVLAAQLVGVPARVLTDVAERPLGPWAPWLGVALFGTGVVVHLCARRASAPWIILVLYVAYAGQVIGGLFFGGVLSAFAGAVLMTPVAMLVARTSTGPTTLVSFLPAFWLLVPGALGLVGVTKYIGDERAYGAESLVTAGAIMVAIALGVLIGTSLGNAVERTLDGRNGRDHAPRYR